MNRRRFLARSSALAASSFVGFDLFSQSARADGCGGPPAGVQLFTVREALARDPGAALRSLREIGIVEAELFGLNGPENATLFGLPARELKRAFDGAGIRVPISHIGGALDEHRRDRRDRAHARRRNPRRSVAERVQRATAEWSPAKSRAQLDALAEKLNRVGREYREQGLTFGYHNHHVEFMPVDGVVPYDYLMSNTDPSLVKIELDIGWLATAGVDPVTYLRRHAGRVIACHLKDYNPAIATDVPQRKLVAPGAGTHRLRGRACGDERDGVAHGFIEVDVSDDALGDVRRGHAHLQSLKGCAA